MGLACEKRCDSDSFTERVKCIREFADTNLSTRNMFRISIIEHKWMEWENFAIFVIKIHERWESKEMRTHSTCTIRVCWTCMLRLKIISSSFHVGSRWSGGLRSTKVEKSSSCWTIPNLSDMKCVFAIFAIFIFPFSFIISSLVALKDVSCLAGDSVNRKLDTLPRLFPSRYTYSCRPRMHARLFCAVQINRWCSNCK